MTEPTKEELLTSRGWWIVWVLSFAASLLPPVVHHRCKIAEIIEPLRYPSGLHPAELLLLRWFGELSHVIPIILIALLVHAILRPPSRRAVVSAGALVTAIFSSLYAAYCLTVVSLYLAAYAHAQQGINAQQAAADQPATHIESERKSQLDPDPERRNGSAGSPGP